MEVRGLSSEVGGSPSFRCVQCGSPITTLYIQYSPGNIRLMKCGSCGAVGDEYIECELMIIMIDLILHKPKAYRHLFYNMFGKETVNLESLLWKLLSAYLILDIYRMWVLSTNEKEWPSHAMFVSTVMAIGKMLSSVIFGNVVFFFILVHATKSFLSSSAGFIRWQQTLLALLFSSYFKVFLMAMMVWKFPSSMVFIVDIFVMSSNIVALKDYMFVAGSVITNSPTMRCLAVCATAHSVKFFSHPSWQHLFYEVAQCIIGNQNCIGEWSG